MCEASSEQICVSFFLPVRLILVPICLTVCLLIGRVSIR